MQFFSTKEGWAALCWIETIQGITRMIFVAYLILVLFAIHPVRKTPLFIHSMTSRFSLVSDENTIERKQAVCTGKDKKFPFKI